MKNEKNIKWHKRALKAIKLSLLLLFTTYLLFNPVYSQERKLNYNIIKGGTVIGKINFTELTRGKKQFLSFASDVKTNFIFSFSDQSSETAAFDEGVMVYSSFYQKQNGSVKANKFTIAHGTYYKLVDKNISRVANYPPIRYSMLQLYTTMPITIDKVYSDNYQKHLEIKKVGENKYRLTLPDGNVNYYTYENGVCSKVLIERTLFTLHFILTENSIKN